MEETKPQPKDRAEKADSLIQKHVIAVAAGVALVPLPLVDLPLVTAVQLNMIRMLAKLYDKPFSEQLAKSLISSLMGGSLSSIAGSLLKVIPPVGLVGSAATAAASTYAVGKVFLQHFESGGSFLTFDPAKVREHYARELQNSAASPPVGGGADRDDYGGIMP